MNRHLLLLLLLPTFGIQAQSVPDPSGHWEGTIQAADAAIAIEVDFEKRVNGTIVGTIAVPPQNLRGFPLVIEAMAGRSLTFRFRGARGNRVFQGVVGEDGISMTGDFIQGGYATRFVLTRTGSARIEPPVRSPHVGKELEGPWSATLEGTYDNGIQRRIILMLWNQPDGTSTGSLVNPGDGLEIPIMSITQEASKVTLDLRAIGGSYSGTVNAEGTELVGTLIQGTAVLPVTFRRLPALENGNE